MISERLKQARLKAGLTQKALSIDANVSASMISQYESGKKTPSIEIFLRITDALEVSPDEILGRTISVSSGNSNYIVRVSKEDIKILMELRKYPKLYRKISMEPKETILSWNKRITLS